MLTMAVNFYVGCLNPALTLTSIASKLAPTGLWSIQLLGGIELADRIYHMPRALLNLQNQLPRPIRQPNLRFP